MSDRIYIYPTDTVWGIGANIYSQKAFDQIAEIKGTSKSKPLSVLFSSITQLKEYIDLPAAYTDHWLNKFFSLESTLAIDRHFAMGRIPSWVLGDSHLLAVRCLTIPSIKKIIEEEGAPITTTSFNRSGSPSISLHDDASKLFSEIASQHQFVDDRSFSPSGNASTIIQLNNDFTFSYIRPGTRKEEIEQHIKLLST